MDINFNAIAALLLAYALLVFYASMLVNIMTNVKLRNNTRGVWFIAVLLIPVVAIIYYGYIYDGKFSVKERIDKSLGLK